MSKLNSKYSDQVAWCSNIEKQIEESANKCAMECPTMMVNRASCFAKGAKSEAAKEYWVAVFEKDKSSTEKHLDEFIKLKFDNKPIYSEDEVLNILYLLRKREIQLEKEDNIYFDDFEHLETIEEWFNTIKK